MKNNELIAAIIIVLIITTGAYFIVSTVYQPNHDVITPVSSPHTTEQMVITTVPTVITLTEITPLPEPSLPAVEITNQCFASARTHVTEVSTVLKNNKNKTVSGDIVLKVYDEAGVSLGTFRESLTLPPNGDNRSKIIMYGVDNRKIYSLSTEYPGLSPTPPSKESVNGYKCPSI